MSSERTTELCIHLNPTFRYAPCGAEILYPFRMPRVSVVNLLPDNEPLTFLPESEDIDAGRQG
ncbi:hypothetical protein Barb4_01048 [Bacteroidales bacterium Barb4]|nr:hypothetical protein Barb4_01048 [Bacteroidales bacterium Barb4]